MMGAEARLPRTIASKEDPSRWGRYHTTELAPSRKVIIGSIK